MILHSFALHSAGIDSERGSLSTAPPLWSSPMYCFSILDLVSSSLLFVRVRARFRTHISLGDRHITRGIIFVHNPVVRTTRVTWVEIELSLKVLVISDQSSGSFCLSSMVPALVFYSKVERGAELQICEDSGLNGQCWSQTQPKCINIYYNA